MSTLFIRFKTIISTPKYIRQDIIFKYKLWCPIDGRVCLDHLIGGYLDPETIISQENGPSLLYQLKGDRLTQVMNDILEITHSLSQKKDTPSFSCASLSDADMLCCTGWDRGQLEGIYKLCEVELRGQNLPVSLNPIDALLFFWVKLKTNLSLKQISTLFQQPCSTLSKVFHYVCNALYLTAVLKHLGALHVSRQESLNHHTSFTRTYYGNRVCLILDGTYIYI